MAQLTITKNFNDEKTVLKTLVEDASVLDVDLAVGSLYTDKNNHQWQITKIENDKYVLAIDDTTENKINKRIFEQMIGNEINPVQELKDSYVGNYLGRKIYMTNDNMFKADDRNNKVLVSDNLQELKDAIRESSKEFKDSCLRQKS